MDTELRNIHDQIAILQRRRELLLRDMYIQECLPELMVRAYYAVMMERERPLERQRGHVELEIFPRKDGKIQQIEVLQSELEKLGGANAVLVQLKKLCKCDAVYKEVKRWEHPVSGFDYRTVILVLVLHPDKVKD